MKYSLIASACAVLLAAGLSLTVGAGPIHVDPDGDDIPDMYDNCMLIANANQADADQDGYGQPCDGDMDNDGKVQLADFVTFKSLYLTAPGLSGQTCAGAKGACPANPGCP